MRKFIGLTLALVFGALAFVAAPAPVADAQVPGVVLGPKKLQPVSAVRTAADTSPAIYIKYFSGANTTASTSPTTVAVEADGNLTFVVNGVAYAGFECPFAGALGGVLDVSDAECNTAGEVVDIINSTPRTFATGYFRAALGTALRTDDISAATTLLADTADTEVTSPEGEIVYFDSDGLDDEEIFFWEGNDGGKNFFSSDGVPANPNANLYSFVQYASGKATNAGTLTSWTCYAVKANYITGRGCNSGTDCGQGSEVARIVYTEASAATTVINTSLTEFPYGFYARDEKVFCRHVMSGADTSVFEYVISGFTFPAE